MRKVLISLLACFISFPAMAESGAFKVGWNAYLAADYPAALEVWTKAAENGDVKAQSYVGKLYAFDHDGIVQDDKKAIKWYRMAAEAGDIPAQIAMGEMYARGIGVQKSIADAISWSRKAAQQGDAGAQLVVARHLSKKGATRDYEEAAEWLKESAAQDQPEAQYLLALMYGLGKGVSQSDSKATDLLEEAAEHVPGATLHRFGGNVAERLVGDTKLHPGAIKWLEARASSGDEYAPLFLGMIYFTGTAVSSDRSKALRFYRISAENGNDEAELAEKELAKLLAK